ncbi:hypothetical protein SARC_08406 [Sphaeroforma arctica JP610]|uniref:Uncharacterized protein n=1 Tax=Sphaeroforma arctica JP610 TaxID=667725 RepID=A0A0L0FR86_9EUKA|nr:hypothetical protein SARC_08406 [Sphaeroforma arctica JP610]KNC79194.1 hypothetical protein SARC_08406 [Sphaeroforma arctica JP610]|eukprot:XP_014153096.1 hypothetical protein SARC_08406 [Sphaeroforma arctica JP610]
MVDGNHEKFNRKNKVNSIHESFEFTKQGDSHASGGHRMKREDVLKAAKVLGATVKLRSVRFKRVRGSESGFKGSIGLPYYVV